MNAGSEKPWQKNASNLLVVNSILAAVAAVVVGTFVSDAHRHSVWWLIFGVVALFLFVLSAEKTAEAFTANDVDTYIRYCVFYNLGVLLLLIDLVGILKHYGAFSISLTALWVVLALIGWIWGWGCDTLFLLWRDRAQFKRWRNQLEGEDPDGPVLDHCDKLYLWAKPKVVDVLTRMKPHPK